MSAVTVLPTHRRRGLLRSMMSRLLDDAVAHGEPVAMLTASEGSIYERFGFGISTRSMSIELDRRVVEFARPRPAGRLRLLDGDEAGKLEPDVFDRTRRVYPGAVSRPDAWWTDEQWEPRLGVRYDVAYESPAGTVDGYACYGIHGHFEPGVGAQNRLTVRDLVAVTPEARHALWRYLCEVDLVRTIVDPGAPMDLVLPHLLTSNRAMRVRGMNDAVWTRLLDVPASLEARTYPVSGRITIAVRDELRPGGAADGTFALEAGPDGATVTTGGAPHLVGEVSAVSAAWLGGVRWSALADAGVVEERVPGALTRRRHVRQRPAPVPLHLVLTRPRRLRDGPPDGPASEQTVNRARHGHGEVAGARSPLSLGGVDDLVGAHLRPAVPRDAGSRPA